MYHLKHIINLIYDFNIIGTEFNRTISESTGKYHKLYIFYESKKTKKTFFIKIKILNNTTFDIEVFNNSIKDILLCGFYKFSDIENLLNKCIDKIQYKY